LIDAPLTCGKRAEQLRREQNSYESKVNQISNINQYSQIKKYNLTQLFETPAVIFIQADICKGLATARLLNTTETLF